MTVAPLPSALTGCLKMTGLILPFGREPGQPLVFLALEGPRPLCDSWYAIATQERQRREHGWTFVLHDGPAARGAAVPMQHSLVDIGGLGCRQGSHRWICTKTISLCYHPARDQAIARVRVNIMQSSLV